LFSINQVEQRGADQHARQTYQPHRFIINLFNRFEHPPPSAWRYKRQHALDYQHQAESNRKLVKHGWKPRMSDFLTLSTKQTISQSRRSPVMTLFQLQTNENSSNSAVVA
jgi:hypothetical protein